MADNATVRGGRPPTERQVRTTHFQRQSEEDQRRQETAGVDVASAPRKEDASTVTPVHARPKADETVGARYYELTNDRIARRDEGIRTDLGECPTCGNIETAPSGVGKSYMACPVCGDTIRFTGLPVRPADNEPLPPIDQDELRSSVTADERAAANRTEERRATAEKAADK